MSGTNYISGFTYNAAGEPLSFTYGNGVTASFNYNDHQQIYTLGYTNGSNPLLSLTYGYGANNNGQIQSTADGRGAAYSTSYTYDPLGRLQQAQTSDLSSTNTWRLEWAYDRYGNRLSQTLTGGSEAAFQPQLSADPATNRINSPGYAYDASGEMTNDTLHSYTYDAVGQMVQVDGGAASYVYDGNGSRVEKTVGGTTTVYIYSGGKDIAEYSGGSLTKEYVYSGSQMIAEIPAGGTPTYGHPDHLSVRVQTDVNGNVVRTYGHLPFGDTWYETLGSDKWQFTGDERDSETGLDHTQFRAVSSRLGRWLTPDPSGLASGSPGDPQSLNLYAYVGNGPINSDDPLGLGPHGCKLVAGESLLGSMPDFMIGPCGMPGLDGGEGDEGFPGDGGGISVDGGPLAFTPGGGSPLDWMNIPVVGYGWVPASGSGPGPSSSGAGYSTTSTIYLVGYWGQVQLGTGLDLLGGKAWWGASAGDTDGAGNNAFTIGIRASGQSWSQCMAGNANTYSIGGATELAVNVATGTNSNISQTTSIVTGNGITGLIFEGPGTGDFLSAAGYGAGSPLTYGRRASSIMSLNSAGSGGLPQALGSTGAKGVLETAGKWLNLGLDEAEKFAVDAGLAGAESIDCAFHR